MAWKAVFGVRVLILFFVILSVMATAAIIYRNIKSGLKIKKLILTFILCTAGFIFAWRQPYLSEKAHVLEFALLGWLVMSDLKDILRAFIFAAIIGYLGEGIQKFLPWRVFEIRDIVTNISSSAIGVILFRLNRN